MKPAVVAVLLSLALGVAAPAAAQQGADGPGWNPWSGQGWGGPDQGGGMGWGIGRGRAGGAADAPGRGRFTAIDVDENGVITAEEAASAVDQVFSAMDADDDGALTRDEYLAVRMGGGGGWNTERMAARQAAKEARFGEMDMDRDGAVSRAEFIDGGRAHFEAADADGDGRVTPWEFRRQAWN